VIALLADRELSGGVKNTRLAVRKQRDGVSGFEIPFTARTVETGRDDDGDPLTAPVIDWQATEQTVHADARWTPSMQVRRVLMTALVDCGQNVRPFLDGPEVRACDIELVRREFCRQYPANGTDRQKADTRRKAFSRSLTETTARGLVATREVEGVQLIWLATPEGAMSSTTRTNGRESGTGQDTPLGVCPCPAPTPCGTWRDIVRSCPAVPQRPLMESKTAATRFFWSHAECACRASLLPGVLNQHQEAA
jgi:Fe-S-cluster containining protein